MATSSSWTTWRGTRRPPRATPIEAAGAKLLSLPPYSPDFNALLSEVEGPIEQAFSKLKAPLRKAAERTIHDLWDVTGRILDLYSAQECANYLGNALYDADRSETGQTMRWSCARAIDVRTI